MRRLWLASASPRRAELLRQVGVAFALLPAPAADESVRPGESADAYVLRLAALKANAGWRRLGQDLRADAVVLGADTTVVCGSRILGKPAAAEEARTMLHALSGTWHEVLTAVCLRYADGHRQALSRTRVHFCELDDETVERYLATGEPFDKAGGYGIQGLGGLLVDALEGSYSGVVGLPLAETGRLLRQLDVDFWHGGTGAP